MTPEHRQEEQDLMNGLPQTKMQAGHQSPESTGWKGMCVRRLVAVARCLTETPEEGRIHPDSQTTAVQSTVVGRHDCGNTVQQSGNRERQVSVLSSLPPSTF